MELYYFVPLMYMIIEGMADETTTTPGTTLPGTSPVSSESTASGSTKTTGAYELTTYKLKVCLGDTESDANCNNTFKATLLDSFHPALDMKIFDTPVCLTTLVKSSEQEPARKCVVYGETIHYATKNVYPFVLHFYNRPNEDVLSVTTFWGTRVDPASYSNPPTGLFSQSTPAGLAQVDGVYETMGIQVILCQGDERSEKNCNADFKAQVLSSFHTDYNLTITADLVCRTIVSTEPSTTSPTTTTPGTTSGFVTGLRRCVVRGTYLDRETKKPKPFLFHCFNHGRDPNVVLIAYWGPRAPPNYSDGTLPPTPSTEATTTT